MSDRVVRAVPRATPETRPFWDGAAAGELRVQRCRGCSRHFFYPRPACPRCGSDDVEWVRASGRATLYSYVINHRPAPGYDAPYAIAVVELDGLDGCVRMMANIVNTEITPENLALDMPLRVVFESRDGMAVPMFEPAR